MSSSPSTHSQAQPTDANQTLEPSRGPSDTSAPNETNLDQGRRRATGRWRRQKPRAPIVQEKSASDATPLRPHANRPASEDPSPTSVRAQSGNRNRPPHPAKGRATDSHTQDTKPSAPAGQRRRAGRFNPTLSEPKADAPAPSGRTNTSRKRSKVPAGDDLTSILSFSLSTPPFPECMICFNPVRPEQPTWSCSPRDEKEAQSCWNTFHLKCIQPWAEKSVKDMEEAWRARGEEKKGEWRCPGCQSKREIVPRKYW